MLKRSHILSQLSDYLLLKFELVFGDFEFLLQICMISSHLLCLVDTPDDLILNVALGAVELVH